MYLEPVLLYTCPLIIAISSWWVDLETDTFFRDPTTPAAPQFCLREKSSCRAKQWEERVRERKKWQRFLPQCSVTGGAILDFLSWFWCLCHHDYHQWIIYGWDCLWDSAKKKKKSTSSYTFWQKSTSSYAFWLRGTSCPKMLARKAKFLSGFWLSMPHCKVLQWDYLA